MCYSCKKNAGWKRSSRGSAIGHNRLKAQLKTPPAIVRKKIYIYIIYDLLLYICSYSEVAWNSGEEESEGNN